MAKVRYLPPGYVITYPNRDKPGSKLMRVVVMGVLVASALLLLAVTIGGWSKLEGMLVLNFLWCLIYPVIAFYVWRWARGLLPIAAALATVMLIPAVAAVTGIGGASWEQRGSAGYTTAHTLFGGAGFSAHTLSLLTWLVIPMQLALVAVATVAFLQGWNIEYEELESTVAR